MFQSDAVGVQSFVAMMMALAYIFNACLSAVGIRFVVARAKKCWDFGATIYFFHFCLTWLVDGFPQRALWWLLMGGCTAVTILLGEFLCVQFEMADIPLTGLGTLFLVLIVFQPSIPFHSTFHAQSLNNPTCSDVCGTRIS
jgi:hypothetical protein